MKRISRKNRYISDLVWEKDHFETELKKAKPWSETGKFPWIYYLGDRFTVVQARARIKELTAEIEHVQSDDSYTPWKDDFDFEKHTIEDIRRNLDQQEIELTPYEKSVEVHKKRIEAMGQEPFDDATQEEDTRMSYGTATKIMAPPEDEEEDDDQSDNGGRHF